MIFENEVKAAEFIKEHQKPCDYIVSSRKETKELKALLAGKEFKKLLINQIEHIEGSKRAKARENYARNVVDFFERLLRPVDNVYHSTGGSKTFDIKNADQKKALMKAITNVRGGNTLQSWLETYWMPQYHKDPAGIVFLEYTTKDGVKIYPTYKSINTIRYYDYVGQHLNVLLFEPKPIKHENNDALLWRLVDDEKEYFFIQYKEALIYMEEKSFEHPFGRVPGLINSNIIDMDDNLFLRKSPIEPIVDLSKEYARDQSVKTLYKALQGIPIHWRYVTECKSCKGTTQVENKPCGSCSGKGYYGSKDVSDQVNILAPKKDQPTIAPNIAGYISPDLATWGEYNNELEMLENIANGTLWGTTYERQSNETATGRFIDVQPVMNRLNKYADVAEAMENQLVEWYANALDPNKKKDERVASIMYGRRYIIEPTDVILSKYQEAKKNGDNAVILDRLYGEYLTSKFKNDPQSLRISLIKSEVEPYLHLSYSIIKDVFGDTEAQKKGLFDEWWKTLSPDDYNKGAEQLKNEYDQWFISQQPQSDEIEPDKAAIIQAQAGLRGSVGGVTGIVAIMTALSENKITVSAAKAVLISIYGFDEATANEIVTK